MFRGENAFPHSPASRFKIGKISGDFFLLHFPPKAVLEHTLWGSGQAKKEKKKKKAGPK